ncbi:superinfection immunity protein [Novosphingobium aquae]|uniref:Superinfection immunity protein n=1 Tax=Novosphingobium aquae TaxID=3133435 RepID=A0ABU8SCD5_9SPHN
MNSKLTEPIVPEKYRAQYTRICIAFIIAGISFFYLLPTAIAYGRKHNTASICVINLFLGWTLIGWVIALAMAVAPRKI